MASARKILVVDDEEHVVELVKLALRGRDFQILAACSGAECLELAESELPALILLDVSLPDIGGLEICRRLKSQDKTKTIPVVFFSAMAQQ